MGVNLVNNLVSIKLQSQLMLQKRKLILNLIKILQFFYEKTRIVPWILTAIFSIKLIMQIPEALNSGHLIYVVMTVIGNAIIPAIVWIITYFVEKRIQQREDNAQNSNNNSNSENANDKPGAEQIFAIIPLVGWIMAYNASKYSKKKADRYLLLSIIGLVLGIIYNYSN